jgi:hypothetical protein
LDLQGLLKGRLLHGGWFEATREREEENEVWGEYECCGVSCKEFCGAVWGVELLRNLLCLAFILATGNWVLQELSADIKQGDCVCLNQTYLGVSL